MRRKSFFVLLPLSALLACMVIGAIFSIDYLKDQNRIIRDKFEGNRWAVPAVVYARPLELYTGLQLTADVLERELLLAGYRNENPVQSAGGYFRDNNSFDIITRDFVYPTGPEPSTRIKASIKANRVSTLTTADHTENLPFIRIDPAQIGSFHPLVHEDRLILTPEDVPEILKLGLIAVEDKSYFKHQGVDPIGIARALVANIKAGRTVQGGSTLTQQLVKNFFLNHERTLERKIQEAVMALLLDYNYSKEEILTAYLNEVFLGQDGSRAIHGFGLASHFYFQRDLDNLSVAQIATLIGMIKGPSYYDPRRNPKRCTNRRNTVLSVMHADNLISTQEYEEALDAPIADIATRESGLNRFPAFLDLVQQQLKDDYDENDLKSNGLKILTTLNPQTQWTVEEQLQKSYESLSKSSGNDSLQGAAIVTGRDSGEVLALAGSIQPIDTGFNRALRAKRLVGSVLKPAIYLSAIDAGYTLASPVVDRTVEIEIDGKTWKPRNFSRREYGVVPLYKALAKSYNLATVNLGLNIGLPSVIETLHELGYDSPVNEYPSLLLGAINMTPFEMSQIYQTIGSGGFYQPLRAIESVMDSNNELLTRYGLEVEQRFSPEQIFLITHAMELVMTEGTGAGYGPARKYRFAGKTGTTNDLRDSWFAGFSDNHIGVVWLGNDDNSSVKLTGSSGALRVWVDLFTQLDPNVNKPVQPADIVWKRIDDDTLEPTYSQDDGTMIPFIKGTEPQSFWQTPGRQLKKFENGARRFFDQMGNMIK
ncbi:penicillin-binding protein 1B [Desulfosediminicola sp.]|uniref:penicillin-binding protein 1B n=1 Tax=Desulfosediminicola sp. TaxID=2886825 RepID=UPI003AF2286A